MPIRDWKFYHFGYCFDSTMICNGKLILRIPWDICSHNKVTTNRTPFHPIVWRVGWCTIFLLFISFIFSELWVEIDKTLALHNSMETTSFEMPVNLTLGTYKLLWLVLPDVPICWCWFLVSRFSQWSRQIPKCGLSSFYGNHVWRIFGHFQQLKLIRKFKFTWKKVFLKCKSNQINKG